ncbi:MAG: membrane dipeptidase [Planctomycetes bacterium]|nr:membrane dipeptidase [Planctomycetota bacterium]
MIYADAHADTFYEAALKGHDPRAEGSPLHINLPRMRRANQRLQVCSVFTPARYCGIEATSFADRIIDCIDANVGVDFAKVGSRKDLERVAKASSLRIGLIPWLEGASPLAGDMAKLDEFFARGVRGIGLTHNHRNEVADGCGCAEPRNGLSDFGRKLVGEMERRGIAVDCAHLPQPAFDEVMDLIKRAPCISHTGCRALVGIVRNADDAMLRSIAERDGFIGIDFYPGHVLGDAFKPGTRRATCEDVAAHVLHAIKVAGIEHVGIGSDFDGFEDTCADLKHLGDIDNLQRTLGAHGLNDSALERIFGANLLAYLERVLP